MGRDRGHGSQARTSGIQGCVYAIIPPTEPTDQSAIQGMFLLSHLWARVFFVSVKPLYVSSPLRTRVCFDQICRDCESKIS